MRTIAVGSKIKTLRTEHRMTQEQLAAVLGVTPQAVSRWEVAKAYPDLELLPVIAAYFSVSTDFLLGLMDP
ncbi:MAG: helix-turn-helix transcriptional regulator [Oscillospiraceae bacterium]|nr:helix-turn-helix transcriptional regulator [Oscillospiraceae bacterium]